MEEVEVLYDVKLSAVIRLSVGPQNPLSGEALKEALAESFWNLLRDSGFDPDLVDSAEILAVETEDGVLLTTREGGYGC